MRPKVLHDHIRSWRAAALVLAQKHVLHACAHISHTPRFCVTMFMAFVTATLFLRTNLHPDSISSANEYFSVVFFSLIMLMFDGLAEETLTVQARAML